MLGAWLAAQAQAVAAPGGGLLLPVLLLPVLVLMEAAYLVFAALGAVRFVWRQQMAGPGPCRRPWVSCIVTCYGEGQGVQRTLLSLLDQDYPGAMEILAVVDGAAAQPVTLQAAQALQAQARRFAARELRVVAKWLRGGRASSLNAGLVLARGEIVMALDGDTSFDRDMVRRAVTHFACPGVVALAGTLRVRNRRRNLLTRLQALDYLLFRQLVRTGLGEFNVINNVPGAHGIFRRDYLCRVGGWDNGSAEDVDLALRLRQHFHRHPRLRIVADPHVISHTDVPERWAEFLRQRLRWEGDPLYLFLRKHWRSLRPSLLGWRNFLFCLWYGLVLQMLMPLLFLMSVLALLTLAPPALAAQALAVAYATYLLVALALCLVQLLLISERPRQDAALLLLLPLYPAFVFLMRGWSALAVCHSLLLRSHLDSSMAPWWVLRKSRF